MYILNLFLFISLSFAYLTSLCELSLSREIKTVSSLPNSLSLFSSFGPSPSIRLTLHPEASNLFRKLCARPLMSSPSRLFATKHISFPFLLVLFIFLNKNSEVCTLSKEISPFSPNTSIGKSGYFSFILPATSFFRAFPMISALAPASISSSAISTFSSKVRFSHTAGNLISALNS